MGASATPPFPLMFLSLLGGEGICLGGPAPAATEEDDKDGESAGGVAEAAEAAAAPPTAARRVLGVADLPRPLGGLVGVRPLSLPLSAAASVAAGRPGLPDGLKSAGAALPALPALSALAGAEPGAGAATAGVPPLPAFLPPSPLPGDEGAPPPDDTANPAGLSLPPLAPIDAAAAAEVDFFLLSFALLLLLLLLVLPPLALSTACGDADAAAPAILSGVPADADDGSLPLLDGGDRLAAGGRGLAVAVPAAATNAPAPPSLFLLPFARCCLAFCCCLFFGDCGAEPLLNQLSSCGISASLDPDCCCRCLLLLLTKMKAARQQPISTAPPRPTPRPMPVAALEDDPPADTAPPPPEPPPDPSPPARSSITYVKRDTPPSLALPLAGANSAGTPSQLRGVSRGTSASAAGSTQFHHSSATRQKVSCAAVALAASDVSAASISGRRALTSGGMATIRRTTSLLPAGAALAVQSTGGRSPCRPRAPWRLATLLS